MNSLRNKIQNAIIGSVLIVVIFAGAVMFITQLNVQQNQKLIKTMTMEYSLIPLADELIQSYNDTVKNQNDVSIKNNYQSIRGQLLNVISNLKIEIVSSESKAILIGVENNIKKVIFECDTGIEEIQNNNFLNISNHFIQANINNDYVHENTQLLLQKELEYLSNTQEKSNRIYVISVTTSVVIFFAIFIATFFYARFFSKQLISPIEELRKITQRVADGDMDTLIDQKLIDQKNEVGALSKSFSTMINIIKTKISELNDSNKKINDSKNALEENNEKLEKLNRFMVDRELKMIELKKRIST